MGYTSLISVQVTAKKNYYGKKPELHNVVKRHGRMESKFFAFKNYTMAALAGPTIHHVDLHTFIVEDSFFAKQSQP